ncbi:MAG: 23S rRNA (guanosine(2251)-2'-O)-methyltransferase RlmB [Bacilli bacterium]
MKVFGRNVFNEYRNNVSDIKKVYLSKGFSDKDIISFIKDNHIKYEVLDNKAMDGMVIGNHQGIIMQIDDYEYVSVDTMFDDDIIVILDHLEDPHNFGAIIRTCESAGIKSIIIPKDRSVSVNSTVMKTSVGALKYVNIAMVSNLVNTIEQLKNKGFFVYAADMDGINYKKCSFAPKTVLVIGSEGNGVGRLVKSKCDEIVSIPMVGHVNSLNASVAAAILIYGIVNK